MIETVKIDIDSVEYPARLREIHNPPAQLYCAGNISLLNERSVGVVGARKNTVSRGASATVTRKTSLRYTIRRLICRLRIFLTI